MYNTNIEIGITNQRNLYKYVRIHIINIMNSKGLKTMSTQNVTLKVNSELYKTYKQYCKNKGLIMSRQFEILMEKQLKEGRE